MAITDLYIERIAVTEFLSRGGSRNLRRGGAVCHVLPFLSSPFLLSLTFLPPPLELVPLRPGDLEERCKLPSGIRDGAPAENEFCAL